MIIGEDRVWAGSETSLQAALKAEEGIGAKLAAGVLTASEQEEGPRLLEVNDGLATITIKGSLVNSDSPLLRFFGVTGYPEIRDAMVAAAQDTSVGEILLDIDSGGGAVSGVADVANLIRMVNDRVKPVTAYTDGVMASAAYWLGSGAGEVYSGKTALVGSIGIISTHKEYTEAYKKEGIGVTVVRAGKDKALANSNEKLGDKGRAQIQQVVNASYEVFVDHVASMRGKSYDYADKQMADGQEFIGKAAVDVGLTDGITTFDAVVSDLKEKIIASSEKLMQNRGKGTSHLMVGSLSGETDMARKALSEQEVAALAAGAAVVATQEAVETTAVTAEVATETTEAAVAEAADMKQSQEAAKDGGENVDTSSATVQLLNAQLKEKDEALLQAGIKISKLEEKLVDAEATHAPLLEIAAKSINNMQIALGGSALSLEGMSAVAVVGEHKRLSDQFASRFKVGGVAAVDTTDAEKSETAVTDSLTKARLAATRF